MKETTERCAVVVDQREFLVFELDHLVFRPIMDFFSPLQIGSHLALRTFPVVLLPVGRIVDPGEPKSEAGIPHAKAPSARASPGVRFRNYAGRVRG